MVWSDRSCGVDSVSGRMTYGLRKVASSWYQTTGESFTLEDNRAEIQRLDRCWKPKYMGSLTQGNTYVYVVDAGLCV